MAKSKVISPLKKQTKMEKVVQKASKSNKEVL